MITPSTGELNFTGKLRIGAHARITDLHEMASKDASSSRPLPVEGWNKHSLGIHSSPDYGEFIVEVVTGADNRVEGVFLSHCHPFYDEPAVDDSERRVFHEGVIASELWEQTDFSWGHVFCRLDREAQRDWLVIIYSPFANVPLRDAEVQRTLAARNPPDDR